MSFIAFVATYKHHSLQSDLWFLAKMVLKTSGEPLSWVETKKHADYVRREGIRQFIRQYHKLSKASGAALYFGDEIEYTLIHVDPKTKAAKLLLIASELVPYMQWEENKLPPYAFLVDAYVTFIVFLIL